MAHAPHSVAQLEEILSLPSVTSIKAMANLDGDLALLGAGGKMGPTLARMALNACREAGRPRRIIAVSRFSDSDVRNRLESWGVETIVCDLLDEQAIAKLPDAANIIAMTGMKFGASQNPELTWAMNCYMPALICKRYRDSRIVAFSSGNVYSMLPVDSQGSTEEDPPDPIGEYSITVLGRERMYQYFSRELSIPLVLLRLNYATELRYGILVDIARAVFDEQPVDVSTPVFNVIWQADANAMTLAAFDHASTPAAIINVAGPEILSVRDVALAMGRQMDKPVRFQGQESATAYLNDGRRGHQLLGEISHDAHEMIEWTADWVQRGGADLGKPTHFQERSGKF